MSKICAYCSLPNRMSREHIWPNGFLRRGNFGIKYSKRAGRTFQGDLIVRDVCEHCNNGPLSRLDAYACTLYDTNFGRFPEHFEPVVFAYDYGRLLRWLIKIAFNTARANKHQDAELLSRYRGSLLADFDNSPINAHVYVALTGPGSLDFCDRPSRKIYPQLARSGPIVLPGVGGCHQVITRMVMINAYAFTLIVSRTPKVFSRDVAGSLRQVPGEPLALEGRMGLFTSLNANQVLNGVSGWPRGHGGKR
jgi:hypothetical protein